MFFRSGPRRVAAVLIPVSMLAGCGTLSASGDDERHIDVGTTSAPSTLDPAAAWDGSWELYRNVYQTLMHYAGTSTVPQPDAAKSCGFTGADSRTYRCKLREDLTFSNGNALDAAAVKHSFDRVLAINAETGPAGLLDSLEKVETEGDRTVTFHLKRPDATFPFILAAPATSLVDPEEYPADKLAEPGTLVGSGPYTLASYKKGSVAELERNSSYQGDAELRNDSVSIRYFDDSDAMTDALKKGDIDVTYRGLPPDRVPELEKTADEKGSIALSRVVMPEIHYLVFNPEHEYADSLAVRQAVAQVIDRDALVRKVYGRTAEPLYSMIPRGITGHTTPFFDRYGEPDPEAAAVTLQTAGVTEPVPLTFWYTTDRYGSVTAREFEELERQLEDSGLFEVTVKGRKWEKFAAAYNKGEYPVFGRGWSPDFPDPDNYIAPFTGARNALGTPYENEEITDDLLPASRRKADRAGVNEQFSRAQDILAEDARLLPLWQARQYIAADDDVAGVEWSLDASTIMRMWELYKKTSW
ncbi:ABC transporter substrate-binding protein [Streptomyces sp. CMB-StM0423]|uniref:ABC transporter substrate-binding protein n=1 Tax=Streptomyces sp. CMB-StM0423 TaxID=2059884 RepID=UPI0018FEB5AD|nr:ABC transporter substrate-binding protein [Streptomyces sp. CMB-StM0423]